MKITKDLAFQADARARVISGINALADAVQITLGPKGQIVLVEGDGHTTSNLVTKDGVTVAKQVTLKDPIADMGAAMLKDAALRANEQAGDGTTTTVVLARALVNHAIDSVNKGVSPVTLVSELENLGEVIEKRIKEYVRPISSRDDFYKLAFTSSNGDASVATIVADAYTHIGKDGIVMAEESAKTETSVKFLDGFTADYGYASPRFITSMDRAMALLNEPDIVIFRGAVQDLSSIMNILETNLSKDKATVILAKSFAIDVLGLLVSNKAQNGLKVCAIVHDENDETLNDMAVKVGCKVIPEGLKPSVGPDNVGSAKRIQVTQKSVTIVDGQFKKEELDGLHSHITSLLKEDQSPSVKEKLEERLARLIGGVAIVSVGGPTLAYMKEKKDRIDDAICAVRSSVKNGVLPGGGVALYHASHELTDVVTAAGNALRKTLRLPYELLHTSCPDSNVWHGTNARTGEQGDMLDLGVIDPALAPILAVRHAIAVCNLVIQVGCTITNNVDTEPKSVEI